MPVVESTISLEWILGTLAVVALALIGYYLKLEIFTRKTEDKFKDHEERIAQQHIDNVAREERLRGEHENKMLKQQLELEKEIKKVMQEQMESERRYNTGHSNLSSEIAQIKALITQQNTTLGQDIKSIRQDMNSFKEYLKEDKKWKEKQEENKLEFYKTYGGGLEKLRNGNGNEK